MGLAEQLQISGTVVCRLPGKKKHWGLFIAPEETITCRRPEEILPALRRIEQLTASGKFAAGFIAYEAAAAFDADFAVHDVAGFPLSWFGIYSCPPEIVDLPGEKIPLAFTLPPAEPELDKDDYCAAVRRIKHYIIEGDTYQINYTIRTRLPPVAAAGTLFLSLFQAHPAPYAAYVNTGEYRIVSLSPELFLHRVGTSVRSSPMKGTAAREPAADRDRAAAAALRRDDKNRAENLMITDMVRHDLGKVCCPGTVRVKPLFHVDTYRTVHQMISTVHGEISPSLPFCDILQATFPAASITGAPKIRAMQIIRETESAPRKIYTGGIGCLCSGGDFLFNVAIRTLLCDERQTELGVGGGIVYDSVDEDEWRESLLKSHFAAVPPEPFDVLETMLWSRRDGIAFLEEHLVRAARSQRYFGRRWNSGKVRAALAGVTPPGEYARLRMLLDCNGNPAVSHTCQELPGWGKECIKIAVSEERTYSRDPFLYHKTTNRGFYDCKYREAVAAGFDEMIFFNERGNLTEGCISNVFIFLNGQWFTPPCECGLLSGIQRAWLLVRLNAKENFLSLDEVKRARRIILCNSVRGFVTASLPAC